MKRVTGRWLTRRSVRVAGTWSNQDDRHVSTTVGKMETALYIMSRFPPTVPIVVASAAFLAACHEGPDPPDTPLAAAQLRDSAGIEIIENPRPAHGSRLGWVAPEPALSIGTREGDAPYLLFRVRDAMRLPDGRFVVADQGSNELGQGIHNPGRRVRNPGAGDLGGPGMDGLRPARTRSRVRRDSTRPPHLTRSARTTSSATRPTKTASRPCSFGRCRARGRTGSTGQRDRTDTIARPAPPPQLIGRFFLFNPSCCSMYVSPFVIQSGAGSPFR